MTGHRGKALVDLSRLAGADLINCRLHIIKDPAPRNAAQHAERMTHRIKQHLVGLQGIASNREGLAVRQLRVRHLQLHPFAANYGPVLAPVKLKRLARLKYQRHIHPAPTRPKFALPIRLPLANEGSHTAIGTVISRFDQLHVHLLGCALVFTRLAHVLLQPNHQLIRMWCEFTRSIPNLELRLHLPAAQILAHCVPR